MTQIPEPNVDIKRVEKIMNEIGDVEYDKLFWWRKGQWIVYTGKEDGVKQYQLFDRYGDAIIFSEIIKLTHQITTLNKRLIKVNKFNMSDKIENKTL